MRLTELHYFAGKLSQLGTPNVTREDMESLMLRLAEAHSNSLIDEEGNDTHTNWSFSNSFFFAITVVTTIGEFYALILYFLDELHCFFKFSWFIWGIILTETEILETQFSRSDSFNTCRYTESLLFPTLELFVNLCILSRRKHVVTRWSYYSFLRTMHSFFQ